jgi:glycosyltransferase involved in cell wall biosynthesis
MKVSIIIPVYNVEPYIERCLLSALNQTYEDIEIILVDDCGQDKSMEIAEEIVAGHIRSGRVKMLKHSQNRGLSAARNTGIEAGTGEYVFFLDSDDEITPNCIERLASFACEQKPDFVIANVRAIGHPEHDFVPIKLTDMLLTGNAEIFRRYLNWELHPTAWNKLINKEFLLNHRLFFKEGILYEDTLWSFMLANHAETVRVVADYTYNYYYRENSITAIDCEKSLSHKLLAYQLISEYVQENNLGLNGLIYNFMEISKTVIFMSLIRKKSNLAAKRKAYRFFCECKLKESAAFAMPFEWKFRDYHYRCFRFLGFYAYYISRWLYIRFVWNKRDLPSQKKKGVVVIYQVHLDENI